jgi:enediyne biosynthesis protein E4
LYGYRAFINRGLRLSPIVAAMITSSAWAVPPTFTDTAVSAGISYLQGPPLDPLATPEVSGMTGGAAAGDFDGDGWVDLFITRSNNTDILYRNLGNGTFADVSASAFGAGPVNAQTNGAAWADIDNDGDLDLYVTAINSAQHYLYINQGDGTFSEQAALRGASLSGNGTLFGTGVSFGDYDRDGYLDAFVADWRPNGAAPAGTPANARLLRNQGAANPGYFQDVTAAAGVAMDLVTGPNAGQSWSFSPRFSDLDTDGNPDLLIASDFGTSRLFWNNGDGTFTDGTAATGINTGWHDMGSTIGDVDGNGTLDWFVTNINYGSLPDADPNGNRLFLNNGGRSFTDATAAAGVRNGDWGWGAALFDYDNDGDLDLVHTNGFPDGDQYINDPMRFWTNDGTGVFTDAAAAAGLTDTGQGRGLLTFDYDNDGDLDLFIVRNGDSPILYRNDGGADNGYLRVKTIGTVSNRDGIGARITVTPDAALPGESIVFEVNAGSNYLSQSEFTATFGLGPGAATIDLVTIRWPSGIVQQFTDVAVNTTLNAVEMAVADDLNGDGFVGIDDLNIVLAAWNQAVPPGDPLADPSGDGFVGIEDLNMVLGNWNAGTPPNAEASGTVPEPGSLSLLLLCGMKLLTRRHRAPGRRGRTPAT